MLVVVKPAGLQVLPAGPFKARHAARARAFGATSSRAAAAPAHRLGRGTSGLIAFGKTPGARSSLARQFRQSSRWWRDVLAWVEGPRLPDSFAARQPIARVAHGPLQIFAAAEQGKPSLTHTVRVLRRQAAEAALSPPFEGRGAGRPRSRGGPRSPGRRACGACGRRRSEGADHGPSGPNSNTPRRGGREEPLVGERCCSVRRHAEGDAPPGRADTCCTLPRSRSPTRRAARA